jgi:hypothetical protein
MESLLQTLKPSGLKAEKVWFQDGYIFVKMNDQRIFGHPLSWYPILENGTDTQRQSFELWNEGKWLHWEELNEDLSTEGFLSFVKP